MICELCQGTGRSRLVAHWPCPRCHGGRVTFRDRPLEQPRAQPHTAPPKSQATVPLVAILDSIWCLRSGQVRAS